MTQLKYLLTAIILLTLLLGCAQKDKISSSPKTQILIKAEIIKYFRWAQDFDYDDGSSSTFDLTTIKIISPEKYAGKEVKIYHEKELKSDSIYLQVGFISEFIIDEKYIKDEGPYYIYSIEDTLKIVK